MAGWMAGWLVGWAVEVEALIRWFGEGRRGQDRWACGTEEAVDSLENEIQKMGVMCWYDRRMRVGQYEM